uniref:Uncharacterized protein n=1 Tax=Bartonella schoenbuchensis (strain DSM 13525 / NCTC 13165 / R1) TaxID=687861 RepID=E6YYT2_BARSR|nr:hypothetical protein B11C_20371 [Bartonella schoenbuchensis R1]
MQIYGQKTNKAYPLQHIYFESLLVNNDNPACCELENLKYEKLMTNLIQNAIVLIRIIKVMLNYLILQIVKRDLYYLLTPLYINHKFRSSFQHAH